MEDKTEEENLQIKKHATKKSIEPGIIYLSRIPTHMSVKKIRQILSPYGETGRIFLQPNEKTSDKKNRTFTEGWIEFTNKKIAKAVALTLNNNQVGGKRRSPWYHELWNMKYLPKFKWGHLNERLAYEREVHKQKLRTEIAQAKRETNFYIENVERRNIISRMEKRKKKKQETGEVIEDDNKDLSSKADRVWEFTQTEPEIGDRPQKRRKLDTDERSTKRHKSAPTGKKGQNTRKNSNSDKTDKKPNKACENKSFLKSLFSGGLKASDSEDGG